MEVELNELLMDAMNRRASDVHLKVGQPPIFRIDGELVSLDQYPPLKASEVAKIAYQIMSE
ncbi:MAG: type IV pili twitching motility protein PilT, partial [Deltaproteobacteria bacterium]